ncbi:MAG: DNA alkylation repair protein [Verrucomicrobiaceae bacterium]|nr:MAG: DNA alkylation repair protein [Verrucomicrobiaceae bacterium]
MESTPAPAAAPVLKEIFNAARFEAMAIHLAEAHPGFDSRRFMRMALEGLEGLSLMQRLRRMTECLHATLPADYRQAIAILRRVAPRMGGGFATLVLPDFVGLHGLDDFTVSMEALRFFTSFGSSEFAVREFLRRDPDRTLKVMTQWSLDADEHVRRLASEGCRPRLPWSFHLPVLAADPSLAAPILENLRADPSLYVRKSVANHLNDITKAHPDWVMDRLSAWPMDHKHTAWIAKRALRTLIKKGDARALTLTGATGAPQATLRSLRAEPKQLRLGDRLTLTFELQSTSPAPQRLVVDYAIHYPKKSGAVSAKVFKLKEVALAAGETVSLSRSQVIRDFTTRKHQAGRHEVDILVNGVVLGRGFFDLAVPS